MDERQLNDLFAEAAAQAGHHAPPPEFDHASVVARSRAATERARRWQSGLTAAAVLVVAGAGLTSIQFLGSSARPPASLAEPGPPAAAAGPSPFAVSPSPRPRIQEAPALPGPAGSPSTPAAPPAEPGAPPSNGGLAPSFQEKRRATSSCARPDAGLFAQLRRALPAAARATARPLADDAPCPEGARGVEVDVRDGAARGVLRVQLNPPGTGGSDVAGHGASVHTTSARTPSGARLVVTMITPTPGPIPYAARLAQLARTLARGN